MLSFDLFIYELPYSSPIIMMTYYAAQLGIALSVVDSYESHEINNEVIQHEDIIKGAKSVYSHLKSFQIKYTADTAELSFKQE